MWMLPKVVRAQEGQLKIDWLARKVAFSSAQQQAHLGGQ